MNGRGLGPDRPVHFQFPSLRVPLVPEVTDYARASFTPGRSAYGGAFDLMQRIRADFTFDAKATTVHTPLAEAFVAAVKAGDVEQAKAMIDMGIPKAEVARTFGVSRQTLYTSLARGVETGG